MADLQRPGGELASRPIHFFWVVDVQVQCLMTERWKW